MGAVISKLIFKNKYETALNIPKDFFSLSYPDIDGKLVDFSSFKGKTKCFLISNVASK